MQSAICPDLTHVDCRAMQPHHCLDAGNLGVVNSLAAARLHVHMLIMVPHIHAGETFCEYFAEHCAAVRVKNTFDVGATIRLGCTCIQLAVIEPSIHYICWPYVAGHLQVLPEMPRPAGRGIGGHVCSACIGEAAEQKLCFRPSLSRGGQGLTRSKIFCLGNVEALVKRPWYPWRQLACIM